MLLPADAQSALFKWVAILTGSKNALKGAGFFAGGALLSLFGFQSAILCLLSLLLVVWLFSLWQLKAGLGKSKYKAKFKDLVSKSRAINVLSAARLLLFAARDVWFVVALPVYLSTVFLANRARVNDQDPSLAYHMDLGVRVPDYEVNRRFWPNSHFEGAYLFRDQLVVKMVPPAQPGGVWSVAHGWASKGVGQATEATDYRALGQGLFELKVDFASSGQVPGIKGQVLLSASAWNV